MNRITKSILARSILALGLAGLVAAPVRALETIRYAEKDGTIKTSELASVTKADESKFSAFVLQGGRRRPLRIDSRQIIELRRGDSDSINQWSKRLAHGKRLMAAGRIANQGTASGAEETFAKIASSVEQGTKGQEETERVHPWHNMYAQFYLIEARMKLGREGNAAKLSEALTAIAQFRKRSAAKAKAKIDMPIPDFKGGTREATVFGWGANRLSPYVELYEAQTLALLKKMDEAVTAYDAVIDNTIKKLGPPQLLVGSVLEKAALQAAGKSAQDQEALYRSAGTRLRAAAGRQPDAFGKQVLSRAANRAMLQGADLLFEAALDGKYGVNVPLERYRALRDSSEGKSDTALRIGAQAGVGMCLVEEKGKGEEAYNTLLDVVTNGYEHPDQVARALYYLAKAAPQYAQVIEKSGGSGAFLRDEADRWKSDLQQRFPGSKWAKKAKSE
ncbi:MAG: hypothetical protein ACYS0E_14390 [Planctomycetota bacterium]|jgi:tetratricopeptide (TPR) repeat protein